jgi:hypothetical protein
MEALRQRVKAVESVDVIDGNSHTTEQQQQQAVQPGAINFNSNSNWEPMTAATYMPLAKVKDPFFTDLLLNQTLGSKPHVEWVKELCPQVVEHYDKFPAFKEFVELEGRQLPISTTDYLARGVCTLSIVQQLASSIGATLHLFAGSHLGAVLHGQPIPWDDDIDAALPYSSLEPFLKMCRSAPQVHSNAKLRCVRWGNAVKVYVDYQGMENHIISKKIPWKSPFIDLFFYKILQYKYKQSVLREVSPSGQHRKNAFNVGDYFPTQPFYFAGLYVMGADPYVARKRYKWNTCLLPQWNHRLEKSFSTTRKSLDLDCYRLAQVFPFTYPHGTMRAGNGTSIFILPPLKPSNDTIMSEISIKERNAWAKLL